MQFFYFLTWSNSREGQVNFLISPWIYIDNQPLNNDANPWHIDMKRHLYCMKSSMLGWSCACIRVFACLEPWFIRSFFPSFLPYFLYAALYGMLDASIYWIDLFNSTSTKAVILQKSKISIFFCFNFFHENINTSLLWIILSRN